MKIVTIETRYINYLREFDDRVCYNKDYSHTRPYVGILFKLRNFEYFAPLTSSGKGAKLINCPKQESVTFFPIANCKYGGVNINNMIPVKKGVYTEVNYTISNSDSKKEVDYKILLANQKKFLDSHQKELRLKANKLYSMKTQNKLYSNYDSVTCDFKLLEAKSILYT